MLPLLRLKGPQLGLQAALPELGLFQAVPALPGFLRAAEGTCGKLVTW
jgi:hypothetical protein